MPQLKVIVNKLNKRKGAVTDFSKKGNIVGTLTEGDVFKSVAEVTNNLGTWHIDENGFVVWAGGTAAQWTFDSNKMTWAHDSVVNGGLGVVDLWNELGVRGEGITVAILDSGLNSSLEDFTDSNIKYYNAFLDSSQKENCLDDSFGHGTDCCGILCGGGKSFYGVAPDISLLLIKITNQNGQRIPSAIVRGLERAIEMQSDVISMSFTIPQDNNFQVVHDKIKDAFDKNITVVASAGDSGGVGFPVNEFPASFPECLSIGGINRQKLRSSASTLSDFLSLMGPGEELFSLTNPAQKIRGTSFSAPFVAGIIAIVKSLAKRSATQLSNVLLLDALKKAADKNFPEYNTLEYGSGIINAIATLQLLSFINS